MPSRIARVLTKKILDITSVKELAIHLGIYACLHGPHLKTRAEYRFLSIIGAHCMGMSTVPEVIAANQIGLPCGAVSVLTDECDPDN